MAEPEGGDAHAPIEPTADPPHAPPAQLLRKAVSPAPALASAEPRRRTRSRGDAEAEPTPPADDLARQAGAAAARRASDDIGPAPAESRPPAPDPTHQTGDGDPHTAGKPTVPPIPDSGQHARSAQLQRRREMVAPIPAVAHATPRRPSSPTPGARDSTGRNPTEPRAARTPDDSGSGAATLAPRASKSVVDYGSGAAMTTARASEAVVAQRKRNDAHTADDPTGAAPTADPPQTAPPAQLQRERTAAAPVPALTPAEPRRSTRTRSDTAAEPTQSVRDLPRRTAATAARRVSNERDPTPAEQQSPTPDATRQPGDSHPHTRGKPTTATRAPTADLRRQAAGVPAQCTTEPAIPSRAGSPGSPPELRGSAAGAGEPSARADRADGGAHVERLPVAVRGHPRGSDADEDDTPTRAFDPVAQSRVGPARGAAFQVQRHAAVSPPRHGAHESPIAAQAAHTPAAVPGAPEARGGSDPRTATGPTPPVDGVGTLAAKQHGHHGGGAGSPVSVERVPTPAQLPRSQRSSPRAPTPSRVISRAADEPPAIASSPVAAPDRPPVAGSAASPDPPVQRILGPPAETRPMTADVRTAFEPSQVAGRDRAFMAVGRPGLDVQAALSPPRGSSDRVARAARAPTVQRRAEPGPGARLHNAGSEAAPSPIASELAARPPGLDVARVLSLKRTRGEKLFPRAVAEHTREPVASARLEVPASRAALQPSASPARAAGAPAAAPTTPPAALAALPTPAPPATVQRVTTLAGPDEARERLSEAPDDELEELAHRLYDHIRARFRAELLIDRERAGLLADVY